MSNQTLTTEPKTARRALCQTRFILNTDNFLVASEKLSVNAVYMLLQILAEFGKEGFPDSLELFDSNFEPLLCFHEFYGGLKELDSQDFINAKSEFGSGFRVELGQASENLIEKTF